MGAAPAGRARAHRAVPYAQYEKNGLFEALDVDSPPGPLRIPFNNRPNTAVMYWDSDIAKWIEMASYTLATHYDPALDARIDDSIARIAKAQRPDGYFNTYFIRREPAKRWTNLRDWHELYCAGHLIEAAVAHAQVTGKTRPARRDAALRRLHRDASSALARTSGAAIAAIRRSSLRW